MCIFNHTQYEHVVFQSNSTSLPSHESEYVPSTSHHHQCWVLPAFLNLVIMMEMKGCLILDIICIPLWLRVRLHIFHMFISFSISSIINCLFISFAHFSVGQLVCFIFLCNSALCTLNIILRLLHCQYLWFGFSFHFLFCH